MTISVLLFTLSGCYVLEQANGQLDLRFNQVPLEEAIQHEKKEEIRELLQAVNKIKNFGENTLHLKSTSNFSGYYATDKKGVTFVVTASQKTELTPYTWWFPIIGSVPYKGFFNQEDAIELETALKADGYDTWLFSAPAYSTLGWFKDPITTPMLRNGLPRLADTILHEMSHATIYVKGESDFNEQLATFVGKKGSLAFLQHHGASPDKINQLATSRKKGRIFSKLMHDYTQRLSKLYERLLPFDKTIVERQKIFDALKSKLREMYPAIPASRWTFNNARMLQYQRYKPASPLFEEIWKRSENRWPHFWELIDVHIAQNDW